MGESLIQLCQIPMGSMLGLLLCQGYINDLHYVVKYCKVYHFADSTDLMNFQVSIKAIKKQINHA